MSSWHEVSALWFEATARGLDGRQRRLWLRWKLHGSLYAPFDCAKDVAWIAAQVGRELGGWRKTVIEKPTVVEDDGEPCTDVERRRLRKKHPNGMTLAEVGAELGISLASVRQIEARALRKLRHRSRAEVLRPFIDDDNRYARRALLARGVTP